MLDVDNEDNELQTEKLHDVESWTKSYTSKIIYLRTLKKLSMDAIVSNFETIFNKPTHLNTISLLPVTLRQEFLNFITCVYCFYGSKSYLGELALQLVNTKTLSLNTLHLFEKDDIVSEVEQIVVKKLLETSWRLTNLIVENLPNVFLQPFQPITSLRKLEIWRTELNENHIEMIVRNAPNLVILKCRLDENLITADSLRHLKWLRSLEEFVVFDFQIGDHRLCNLLDEILLYLPHLKVACSKTEYDEHANMMYHSSNVNHFIPLGYGELPLEHLNICPSNMISTAQAKMLPRLKTLCLNMLDEDLQPSNLSTLSHFHYLKNLYFYKSSTETLIDCLHVYGSQLKRLSIDSPPESVDLNHVLNLCPQLEELNIMEYEVDDGETLIIPTFETMDSLISITFNCYGFDLPRGLLPSLFLAPHIKIVHLGCKSVSMEDMKAVGQMARTGAIKTLKYFNLGVKDLSDNAEYVFLKYHLVQCVSRLCPETFPTMKPGCCSV